MKNIKNQKGVTLTSLIVYIIAMVIVIGIIATITKYYYSNLSEINSQVDVSKEYSSLNSYILQDVNNPYNVISECTDNYIVFYNSTNQDDGYHQYTFRENSIYYNKIKICNAVKSCRFTQNNLEPETKFTINITFQNNESKNLDYSIKRDTNISLVGTTMGNAQNAMPDGARILEGTNAETGIVMIDSNENEWVWIEVPTRVFTRSQNSTDYDNIKADLIAYATDYREGRIGQGLNWTDEWYAMDGSTLVTASTSGLTDTQKALTNGCGLNYNDYNTAYQNMLSSVYTNKGFYISRYEIGDKESTQSNTTRTDSTGTSNTPVSKQDQIPYNWVTCSQAQGLANNMKTGTKNASLLFGIQWDLVCKYLEENVDWDTTTNTAQWYIKISSISWGNYRNSSLTLSRGKYNTNAGSSSSTWTAYNVDTTNYVTSSQTSNNASYSQLLTTGVSEEINKMNIYDFAGNEMEWTLEHTSNSTYNCALRGGNYTYSGSDRPAAGRDYYTTTGSQCIFGFRSTLY